MDRFQTSCLDFAQYPKNLICPATYDHYLEKYYKKLQEHQDRLFGAETGAELDILQLEEGLPNAEFRHDVVRTVAQLRVCLRIVARQDKKDPMCRFL